MRLTLAKRILATDPHQIVRCIAEQHPRRLADAFGVAGLDASMTARCSSVAMHLGVDPLHFGVVLVFGMGIGLFAPPLGLGLYGACLIGKVPIEETVKPILGYLGLLFLCLLVIAFVPSISTWLPQAMGYGK